MEWLKGKLGAHRGGIFDLDGTLLDSLWIWSDIDRRFLAKRGITDVPHDYMDAVGTLEFRQAAEYTIKRFGFDENPDDIMAEWREMSVGAYTNELDIKVGVRELLHELKSRGAKLAVATSATPDMCLPALKRNGIAELFEGVVTTYEIGKGKSSPDVYLAAARLLGLEPCDCAVYEDNMSALLTAKNAGFYTVGVYDKYTENNIDELMKHADAYVKFE